MNVVRTKKLPVGIEDFKDIRTEGFYYVDKTAMIRDLLLSWGKVNLFTRPRRFGKSLNMSMLKAFFEIGCDKALFDGLVIAEDKELCEKYMGKFPVISISLKGIAAGDYETARNMTIKVIHEEVRRHRYLIDSKNLMPEDKELFLTLLEKDMRDDTLAYSIRDLSKLLQKHFDRKVIILIDEYDVPLSKASDNGYYDQMVFLIRNLFEQALKTNDSLYFAILTGCLRVAKESIFTGLNNLKILSATSVRFDEYFGFTDDEVRELLAYYHLDNKYNTMKEWYDGYRFGNIDVYCPWDVISYCDELIADPDLEPKDYWSNTSSNSVIRYFIEKLSNGLTSKELEILIEGKTVTKEIHEELTYKNLYDTIDNIWSVLFTTGYLTMRGKPDGKRYELAIPNREIRNIFTDQIMALFKTDVSKDGELLEAFCESLQSGNASEAERLLSGYLSRTVSIRDTFVQKPTKENFYHGILIGILGFKSGWYVKSNRESGDGYSDIIIETDNEDVGIVIEVKYAENGDYEVICQNALKQIEDKAYDAELKKNGCRTIYKYGIACYRKKCKVALKTERI